jgi:hypothetical protein
MDEMLRRAKEQSDADIPMADLESDFSDGDNHELSMLVACGLCVDAGRAAADSLMYGVYQKVDGEARGQLQCARSENHGAGPKKFTVSVNRRNQDIAVLVFDHLLKMRDAEVTRRVAERFPSEPGVDREEHERYVYSRAERAFDEAFVLDCGGFSKAGLLRETVRLWVSVLGYPIICVAKNGEGEREYRLSWPFLDEIHPDPAPDYPDEGKPIPARARRRWPAGSREHIDGRLQPLETVYDAPPSRRRIRHD